MTTPGLALDRLEEHGGGVLVDRGFEGRGIPERHRHEPGRVRSEVVASLRVVAEADDRRGAAVEVAARDDDRRAVGRDALHAVAPGARDLDAGLDRFGAGVHRQHEVLAAQLGERRGEDAELVVVVRAARERQASELLLRGGEDRRMPVAEVQGGVGGEQVEVALALDVGHPRALALGDHDGQRVVVVRDVLFLGRDDRRRARRRASAGRS